MQQDMLCVARSHRNIVLLSPTGSGKTLAYMLPLVECLRDLGSSACVEPEVLVLVPSRELAIQTGEVARKLNQEVRAYACYGGRAAMDEHRAMRGLMPRMIVGTPGQVVGPTSAECREATTPMR